MIRIIRDLKTAALLLRRPPLEAVEVSPGMRERIREVFGEELTVDQAVERIIAAVRARGDEALFDYTRRIEGAALDQLEVSKEEFLAAYRGVGKELLSALSLAARRIRTYHRRRKRRVGIALSREGLGEIVRPLGRVGVYVPGGTASYPSTVLMTAIPARVAGVEEVILVTPPRPDGSIPAATLVAAHIAGVDHAFKVGGAQAIAALAFGTQSIPRVDKICGPGNIFVLLAKKKVFGVVDIDGLHGPTETVILADDSASPEFCAADLLAQAEHDVVASPILITTSSSLAEEVKREIESQLKEIERRDIAREALERKGGIVVVATPEEALELVNSYAPEHLCLMVRSPEVYLDKIRNAGGIFIGCPEVLGDYVAGPSHVMPTGGTARFGSPLGVADFLKATSLVALGEESLESLGPAAATIARAEGLTAHARSVERRLRR